ncbi:hypothetical protein NA56DRAFT_645161 [Hyaloscypha hepaticicola]|uniref:Uncharacterized protein n=1 Tax=Hyaloscypha hepaticicola TaxID=2082293 RepID=A0A2J6Q6Q6_9HELO|nr:hypothetical protein NA56DRAFT_645161 [Hyaloscypha hepaticicola]
MPTSLLSLHLQQRQQQQQQQQQQQPRVAPKPPIQDNSQPTPNQGPTQMLHVFYFPGHPPCCALRRLGRGSDTCSLGLVMPYSLPDC